VRGDTRFRKWLGPELPQGLWNWRCCKGAAARWLAPHKTEVKIYVRKPTRIHSLYTSEGPHFQDALYFLLHQLSVLVLSTFYPSRSDLLRRKEYQHFERLLHIWVDPYVERQLFRLSHSALSHYFQIIIFLHAKMWSFLVEHLFISPGRCCSTSEPDYYSTIS